MGFYCDYAPMGLLRWRPDGATTMTPRWVYCDVAPMGLLWCRPDGFIVMSPRWVYCDVAPMGLLRYRSDGATMMTPRWDYYDVAPMGLLRYRSDGATTISLRWGDNIPFLHFSFQHYEITHFSYRLKHISSCTDSGSCSHTHEILFTDHQVWKQSGVLQEWGFIHLWWWKEVESSRITW
jgi:hypothetical protein